MHNQSTTIMIRTGVWLLAASLLTGLPAFADTHYVNVNSVAPAAPYTNWARAAQVIQHALNAATDGDTVVVTNGVYATGGQVTPGYSLSNRVVVTKNVTLKSVNGPDLTIIKGQGPLGSNAVRCVYISAGIMDGFTLTGGCTLTNTSQREIAGGGGAYAADAAVILTNCTIIRNSARAGGGVVGGTIMNCALTENSVDLALGGGGGAYESTLINCTLVSNVARWGGGANSAMLNACMLATNMAIVGGGGAYGGTLADCTLTGNSAAGGGGAIAATLSNCTLIGNAASANGGAVLGSELASCTLSGNSAQWGGGAMDSTLSNCTLISNNASNSGGGAYSGILFGCALTGNSARWGGGVYTGTLNHCTIESNLASDAAGGVHSGTLSNCTLSGNTAERGGGAYNGNLTSCALSNNTATSSGGGAHSGTLIGCWLTGNSAQWGGGVYTGALNDCTLINNTASEDGGGAYQGTLTDCTLNGNLATHGGGSINGVLNNCVLSSNAARASGGGAYSGTLLGCTLIRNSAIWGGGTAYGTLNSCALSGNVSSSQGGGSYYGKLHNCTLVDNAASFDGGGAYYGTLNNSIVYFNTAQSGANYDHSTLSYCCATPDPGGTGNITNSPALAGTFRLSADSPCLRAGSAAYAEGADIDGESWASPPSMGCDEVHPGTMTGGVNVAISAPYMTIALGTPMDFAGQIIGLVSRSIWDFGDGTVVSNSLATSHAFAAKGLYSVVLSGINESNPAGITTTVQVNVVNQPVHYVNVSNATPVAPFTTWATAATTIQDAIDAVTVPGALVLVTNGLYSTGGRTAEGSLTNRVAITDAIRVRSVNGPAATTIQGSGPLGDSAARCAYVGADAALSGFTLTNGNTRASGDFYERCGGGVRCDPSGVVSNCVISCNAASYYGGAVAYGILNNCIILNNYSEFRGGGSAFSTLNNCVLTENAANYYGGGADFCTLNNCTVTGNSAFSAGGVKDSTLNNSIVYFNMATADPNFDVDSTLRFCCATPTSGGAGNVTNDPGLASVSHLSAISPCIGAGNAAYATGADIDGEIWAAYPAIGCDEVYAGAITGGLSVAIGAECTNVSTGFRVDLEARISGRLTRSVWDLGDGTVITNRPFVSHAYATNGLFTVALTAMNESYPAGVIATARILVVSPPTHYVNLSNQTPTPPFATWGAAATNIQNAIDAASVPGAVILVNDGVYATGGRVVYGALTNRVVIDKGITVKSVNGPATTVIEGSGPLGDGAVRCAYLCADALLSGFTLTNGNTRVSGDFDKEQSGGGVWCELSAAVSNCVISGNHAFAGGGSYNGTLDNCTLSGNSVAGYYGGGSYGGMLNNCTLIGNSVQGSGGEGGGAFGSTLNNCMLAGNSATYGGGSCDGTLDNCALSDNEAGKAGGGSCRDLLSSCTLVGNSTRDYGGGAFYGELKNCTLSGNVSQYYGGGSYRSTLENCTVSDNEAGKTGGGSYEDRLNNCIVYYNAAPTGVNHQASVLIYCCTVPASGSGCVTNAPIFVASGLGDYHLAPSSPGIDAGINQAWMVDATDLAGNPRILNGRVDMGAYETPFTLSLRALLQGPYDTNAHAMAAGNPGSIPLTSPYATDPRTVAAIPSNVVDWVLVELLATNGATVVSKSALLDTGGQLLSADRGSGITAEVSAGYYSVVLKHRNHLAAMSADSVAFTNILTTYDFTTGADRYAGGTSAAVDLEPGVWGLIAGDADGDGSVLAADSGIYSNQVGRAGYHRGDFNLDGTVDGNDLTLWTANQGLRSGASAAGTPLGGGLTISPQRKTVLAGATLTLAVGGTTNPVNWAFVANPSGGTLSSLAATSAVYTAGLMSNSVDVIQAWEGDRVGRAWVNVISSNEVAQAGKAIVIAGGKGPSDPLGPVTDYLADLAYNTLLYRGYAKGNVQYLNAVTDQDVDGNGEFDDVASPTTMASAAATFTNWAMAGTERLFVYLVDHGDTDSSGNGYFRLNGGETLTAVQVDAWLDEIQAACNNEVVVVLDFCYAGSFLDVLKHPKRTVITACGSTELTHFVAGGLVSFSDAFFGAVVSGQDLAGAFGRARDAMGTYPQQALLDADGNGVYNPDDLTSPAVVGKYLGPSFLAGKDIPQIGHVMGDQLLHGATAATLWAYDIVSAYPLDRVWCLVVPPNHNPDPDNPVTDLPSLELSYKPATGRYEAQYGGFTELGPYKLVYYAQDIWGSVSLPRPSFVHQDGYDERMVLVAGGSTNDPQWAATASLAAWAYQTALARRLAKPALRYLSAGPPQDLDGDGTNDVDGAATPANLGDAITAWTTNSNRLTVYLLGASTTNGLCRLNESETLAPAQLDGWLDGYQASNTAALVVMDFDGCGGYLPSLAPPPDRERILIASTRAGAKSSSRADGYASFSQFFLRGVFNGGSIWAAFGTAKEQIMTVTRRWQTPQLDANGNGVANEEDQDKAVAARRYLGPAFVTGSDEPFIGSVIPGQSLTNGASALLWAADVLCGAGISNVWCIITPPDDDGSGELPQTNLAWNAAAGRYEAPYAGFSLPGTYALTFFALGSNGLLSAAVQSMVTATDPYEPDDAPGQATIFPTEEAQRHNFHAAGDEDWVLFYAPTGHVFNVDATQLGTNSNLAIDLYYERPDGSLEAVFPEPVNDRGAGSNLTEHIQMDLAGQPSDYEPGIYFVRIGSTNADLFGPGSDYELHIYEPVGGSGGVVLLQYPGMGFQYGCFSVSLGPAGALGAGAAWQIAELGGAWYTDSRLYAMPVPNSGSWHLSFRDAPGFGAPSGQALSLRANGTTPVATNYAYICTNLTPTVLGVSLGTNRAFGFTSLAYPTKHYALEASTNLLQWVPLRTNQVPMDGILNASVTNAAPRPREFYRWRLIP